MKHPNVSYSDRCQLINVESVFCLHFRINDSSNLPRISALTPSSRSYNLRNSSLIIPPPASSTPKRSLFSLPVYNSIEFHTGYGQISQNI
ncbi:hypothetical protein SprV_0100403000 [Sparganum proliferum]